MRNKLAPSVTLSHETQLDLEIKAHVLAQIAAEEDEEEDEE